MSFIKQKQVENLVQDLGLKANAVDVLMKSNNLSDLSNIAQARTNLDVHSKAEVQALIAGAQNAYSVADIPARAALTGLKVTDRIFVSDDGDGKWAMYIVLTATDGLGSTCEYLKIADQDLFDNAMTASAIKAAYESNADTNAFTDQEKAKLGLITVEQPADLDDMQASIEANANSISLAHTSAANALNAANNAQITANGKQDSFTETTETFTSLQAEENQDITVTVQNPINANHHVQVFFGAVRVKNVTYLGGGRQVTFNVPYVTDKQDEIHVMYAY